MTLSWLGPSESAVYITVSYSELGLNQVNVRILLYTLIWHRVTSVWYEL